MYGVDRSDLEHIWTYIGDCFEDLNQAKLFITGGTGFFGSWLLESIIYAKKELDLKIKVDVLTRDIKRVQKKTPHFFNIENINYYEGDIRNFSFPSGNYTHLIHAATDASAKLNEDNPLEMYDSIFQGTKQVLNFARSANIKKMLFVSSGAVYGQQPNDVLKLHEDFRGGVDPLSSRSAYGLGKLVGEHISSIYARKFNFELKIARCFAFVGPYLPLNTHFAIGNFIKNVIEKTSIFIEGDGTSLRSYLYAADLVIWLWKILCNGKNMEIYNVGSENSISIYDLAQLVKLQSGSNSKVIIKNKAILNGQTSKYIPSIQKACDELGVYEYIDLSEAIQKTISWNLKK